MRQLAPAQKQPVLLLPQRVVVAPCHPLLELELLLASRLVAVGPPGLLLPMCLAWPYLLLHLHHPLPAASLLGLPVSLAQTSSWLCSLTTAAAVRASPWQLRQPRHWHLPLPAPPSLPMQALRRSWEPGLALTWLQHAGWAA